MGDCCYLCFQTRRKCKSFNYESGGETTAEKQRKCQLNNATKSPHFHGMVKEGTFDYWEMQNENSVRYTLSLSCVFNFQGSHKGFRKYVCFGYVLDSLPSVLFSGYLKICILKNSPCTTVLESMTIS